jgi:hypothetical protein
MKPFSKDKLIAVVLVVLVPMLFCIFRVAINAFTPRSEPISVIATVEREVVAIVIRYPSSEPGKKTDLTFFDNNPELGTLSREVVVGPANGTATSPQDYKRIRLSDEEWIIVRNIMTQWCSKAPLGSTDFSLTSGELFYEIGVGCDGFRSSRFFIPFQSSSEELKTLLRFTPNS